MAKSPIQNKNHKATGDISIETGREPVQMGWYEFASDFCKGKDVLDIGCGMGEGLELLARTARSARGIDLDERLKKANVEICDIKDLKGKSVDILACIDVIEHVEEDCDFVLQLVRVARREILVSTPNWTVSRCQWPYHIREYMPHELYELFRPYGTVEMYKGTFDGKDRYRVKYLWAYALLNRLMANSLTHLLARVVNHFLPVAARIHSSLFLHVRLEAAS